MATFYNQATLSFGGNVLNSNTTEAELISGLTLTKTALNGSYGPGDSVIYTITLTNSGTTSYGTLTVNDNLGAYSTPGGTTALPLTYVDGSLRFYLNGVLQSAPTVSGVGGLEISDFILPGGGVATFVYEARVNEFAPIAQGSTIVNTASTDGGIGIGELTDSATITVNEAPSLTIAKAVCPPVISDNQELTYTIIVQNLGNIPIVAGDGVIVSDVFNPVLSGISVSLNGSELTEGAEYTYDEATGAFATADGVITVPAATYTQDPTTGVITTTPGVAILTISGSV